MKYLVCVKHVPKFNRVKIDSQTHNLIREGVRMVINPADLNALTLALKLKKENGGEITVLSMGPPSAKEAVKESLARGADKGYLVCSMDFKGSDTLATSYTLAQTIKKLGDFDIILTGTQTSDGDTGQVGPELAEFLGINQATYLKDAEFKDGYLEILRKIPTGIEKQKLQTPVLLSVMKDANEVGKLRKTKLAEIDDKDIPILSSDDIDADKSRLGVEGSPTQVVKIFELEGKAKGKEIKGETPEEQARQLINVLEENDFI